jgi:hypothetical protein
MNSSQDSVTTYFQAISCASAEISFDDRGPCRMQMNETQKLIATRAHPALMVIPAAEGG